MLLSLDWLNDYFKEIKDKDEVQKGLSLSGTHTESVSVTGENIKNIKTAKILKLEKHPNADRLTICNITFGDCDDVIVTAATNMKEGDIVGVSRPGAILSDGTEIAPHDFRGVMSNGMFVGFEEIGFKKDVINKEDAKGIIILDKDTPLNIDIRDALNINKGVLELEITPNRSDCLSIEGLAYEYASTFNDNKCDLPLFNSTEEISDFPEVVVNTDMVNTYFAGVIKNIKVDKSPLWLRVRLMESGFRPVNNIVDITNYVMLEYGVPLHAFDLDKIVGNKVTVTLEDGKEKVKLIDDREVTTEKGDILIKDESGVIALAGVMGAKRAEVTDETKNVFIESAHFDKNSIKETGKRLQIESEAKTRFQKPLSRTLPKLSIRRAMYLLNEIVSEDNSKIEIREIKFSEEKDRVVELRAEKLEALLGVKIEKDRVIEILNKLGLNTKLEDDKYIVSVPDFRDDITMEVDLIEEVGRLYGYENIPSCEIKTALTVGHMSKGKNLEESVRRFIEGIGFTELLTYSFVGPTLLERAGITKKDTDINLLNPLGEEFSSMRPSMRAHFLEIAEKNIHRSNKNLRFFEIGSVFNRKNNEYNEDKILTLLKLDNEGFYEFKSIIDEIISFLNLGEVRIERSKDSFYHPGRSAEIYKDDKLILNFGEVHPNIEAEFDLKNCYMATIFIEEAIPYFFKEKLYKKMSKYQSVTREFSFLIDKDVLYKDVREAICEINSPLIKSVNYFDEYTSDEMKNKKSLTIQIEIQSDENTLTDAELSETSDLVINKIKERFDANLR